MGAIGNMVAQIITLMIANSIGPICELAIKHYIGDSSNLISYLEDLGSLCPYMELFFTTIANITQIVIKSKP